MVEVVVVVAVGAGVGTGVVATGTCVGNSSFKRGDQSKITMGTYRGVSNGMGT